MPMMISNVGMMLLRTLKGSLATAMPPTVITAVSPTAAIGRMTPGSQRRAMPSRSMQTTRVIGTSTSWSARMFSTMEVRR